jgi:hypothetical protein
MLFPKGDVVAILLFALLPFSICSADSSTEEEIGVGETIDNSADVETKESLWWQDTHQTVSKTIGSWSNNMDSFLSGRPSLSSSDSQVEVRFGPIFDEDESTTGFFDLHAQLQLPNTQERLRLVIESNGDSLTPENVRNESTEQNDVVSSALQSSLSAAVRYIQADIGADFDIGILVDFPLDPFMRLRFTQGDDKASWRWWQKQEAFAYYSKGVGARYSLGGDYKLTSSLSYGADLSVAWLDLDGLFYARENFFLRHSINDKNRLSYQLSFLQSGEHELAPDTILYNVQYERFLYEDWLIGQVKPQFTHEEEEDYKGEFSLTLSLAILLGPEYLH